MMTRWTCSALALLGPCLALAQPHVGDLEMRRVKENSASDDRLAVYITSEFAQTFHDGAFNVAATDVTAGGSTTSSQFVFRATGMEMQTITPQVGMSYAFSSGVLLYGSAGPAFLQVVKRLAPAEFTEYDNSHNLISSTTLQPGFAGTAGLTFAFGRFSNFTVLGGLRINFTSASAVKSDSVTGNLSYQASPTTGSVSTEIDHFKTEDVVLRVVNGKANLGLEWRPKASYLSNHFGITGGYGVAFGSMTNALSLSRTQAGTTLKRESTDTVGFLMAPRSPVGVYYGWSIFIPRFGSLGFEVQALDQFSGNFTYQYTF